MIERELYDLFGELINSPAVLCFLEKYPSFKIEKPSDGSQYLISLELGIDLLFQPDEGPSGGKTKHLRKCQSAFLYSQGKDAHNQYQGLLPLSFSFDDSRQQLIKKALPSRTWKIGEGEVDLSFPNPSHDRWEFDNYFLSAHYAKSSGAVMYFILSTKLT